jgi:hypothetical protein
MRRVLALTALAISLGCGLPAAAPAAAGSSISVSPEIRVSGRYEPVSFFELRARPGQLRRARIVVRNLRQRSLRVVAAAVDAQTADNLGFAYKPRGLKTHGPTRWVNVSPRRLSIGPRGKAAIAVTIKAPRSARAGDYLSGVSVEALGQSREQRPRRGVAISSIQRFAVGTLVRVPGARQPLIRFTGARVERQPAGVTFLLEAENAGNVVLTKVRGQAQITRGKRRVASQRIGPGTFVTGTSIGYPVPALRQQPAQGTEYRVQALMRYRGGVARLDERVTFERGQAETQEQFGGPPAEDARPEWHWAIGGLVLLALVGLALRLWRRRRRHIVGESAGIAMLARELEALKSEGRPVTVMLITDVPTDRKARRRLVAALRPRLRPSDGLFEAGDKQLMVVCRDTGGEVGTGLAADVERVLDRLEPGDGSGSRVRSATAETPIDLDALLGRSGGGSGRDAAVDRSSGSR